MCAFPENQTCDLGVVRVMFYQLNYRNTLLQVLGNLWVIWYESIYFSQNFSGMCTGFLLDHNLEPTENYTTVFYKTSTKHKPESVSFRTQTVVWVFILSSQIKCPCKTLKVIDRKLFRIFKLLQRPPVGFLTVHYQDIVLVMPQSKCLKNFFGS